MHIFVVLYLPQYKTTMNKNTQFFGLSVFGELISLINIILTYR